MIIKMKSRDISIMYCIVHMQSGAPTLSIPGKINIKKKTYIREFYLMII